MKKKKEVFSKADDASMNTKTVCAFVAIAIALMLTVGITMAKQTQEQTVITKLETEKEVPCSRCLQLKEILDEIDLRGSFRTMGGENISLCDMFYEVEPVLTAYADTLGCSGGFSQNQQSSQQQSNITVQGGIYQGGPSGSGGRGSSGDSGWSPLSGLPSGGDPLQSGGSSGIKGHESGGHFFSIPMVSLSEEDVQNRINQAAEWCNGGPEPDYDPYGLGFHLGTAMATCAFIFTMGTGYTLYVASLLSWTLLLGFCWYGIATMLLLEVGLDSYEAGQLIQQAYWFCVDVLTGE